MEKEDAIRDEDAWSNVTSHDMGYEEDTPSEENACPNVVYAALLVAPHLNSDAIKIPQSDFGGEDFAESEGVTRAG
ncbi:hypothetical protein AC578_258 [Pseudocercospora eumusae]|uniref:Uncharacterized protein n=1 Tax=Pseudocercospora eumusae TaxID=321146 RepID=A0A139HIP5_9PEZI|nr:hypothetical protein AC578_258 [Pseudocercospora eumusae]